MWHLLTNTSEAVLTFFCVALMQPANMAEIGCLSVNVLLSLEESYRSCGVNDTPLQLPSTPAFHLHSNRDAWTNRQQAPNLLQRMRGQDETREMACSRHQRANSSGCDLCAKKFPLRRDMGSALEELGLKQHFASNSVVFAHKSRRGGGGTSEGIFCLRPPNHCSFLCGVPSVK